MENRELFDALENFSQNLMVTLAEVEAIKQQLKQLMQENMSLRIENDKLRERLILLESKSESKPARQVKGDLETLYNEGFHVCHNDYAKRRLDNEDCLLCMGMIYRD